jgi:hypothetical protein
VHSVGFSPSGDVLAFASVSHHVPTLRVFRFSLIERVGHDGTLAGLLSTQFDPTHSPTTCLHGSLKTLLVLSLQVTIAGQCFSVAARLAGRPQALARLMIPQHPSRPSVGVVELLVQGRRP